jgi:predicted enzyme related to lactoylglutathione lyase
VQSLFRSILSSFAVIVALPGQRCSPNPDHVYFSVTDLEGTLRSARDAGAVILRPIETQPWGERSFYCTDPFGNKLCFVPADTLFTGGLLN